MIEWIKKHRIISIVIIIILFLIFIIIMPLIINWLYYLDAPNKFFIVSYDISNILDYYGSVLTFIGTISLGVITVYHNHISQRKSDEVNTLTLELQKKSMAMAEQNYEIEKQNEINKYTPKFELRNSGSNGKYMNLQATFKNISNGIVSGIKSVSFEVYDESNIVVVTSDKVRIDKLSLLPGEETKINFQNFGFESKNLIKLYGKQVYDSMKKITMVWGFQCEDSRGITHYYKARLFIEDSNKFVVDAWDVEKVG